MARKLLWMAWLCATMHSVWAVAAISCVSSLHATAGANSACPPASHARVSLAPVPWTAHRIARVAMPRNEAIPSRRVNRFVARASESTFDDQTIDDKNNNNNNNNNDNNNHHDNKNNLNWDEVARQINQEPRFGVDPIGWACHHGRVSVLKALLSRTKDSPVHSLFTAVALKFGYATPVTAEELATKEYGWSSGDFERCLHITTTAEYDVTIRQDIYDTLLQHVPANIRLERVHDTLLRWIIDGERTLVSRLMDIIRHDQQQRFDNVLSTLLLVAAVAMDDIDMTTLLLRNGIRPSTVLRGPLMETVLTSQECMVQLPRLVQYGLSVYSLTVDELVTLFLERRPIQLDGIHFLLERGLPLTVRLQWELSSRHGQWIYRDLAATRKDKMVDYVTEIVAGGHDNEVKELVYHCPQLTDPAVPDAWWSALNTTRSERQERVFEFLTRWQSELEAADAVAASMGPQVKRSDLSSLVFIKANCSLMARALAERSGIRRTDVLSSL